MKKFKNISEFERLLKDRLENHATPPPSSIIENFDLSSIKQSNAKTSKIIESIKNPIQAIKMVSIIGASATILFFAVKNKNSPIKDLNDTISEHSFRTIADSTVNMQDTESIEKDLNDIPKELKTFKNGTTNSLIQTLQTKSTQETQMSFKIVEDESDKSINTGEIPENLDVSNFNPCIGEIITLKSRTKGDWYINNQIFSRNADLIEYKADTDQPVSIVFTNEHGETHEVIEGLKTNYQIITKKIDFNTFSFSINNQNILANWYLDDTLISKNTNKCHLKEKLVGEYVIKTVPINIPCAEKSKTTFQVKSEGSIKFFNVFTPNGDGTNDEYPVEINNYENYKILIFNQRNGQIIFTSDNPENRWNGSINNIGENCPPGEYLAKINYTLKGEKPQTKNIKFTLIRP